MTRYYGYFVASKQAPACNNSIAVPAEYKTIYESAISDTITPNELRDMVEPSILTDKHLSTKLINRSVGLYCIVYSKTNTGNALNSRHVVTWKLY